MAKHLKKSGFKRQSAGGKRYQKKQKKTPRHSFNFTGILGKLKNGLLSVCGKILSACKKTAGKLLSLLPRRERYRSKHGRQNNSKIIPFSESQRYDGSGRHSRDIRSHSSKTSVFWEKVKNALLFAYENTIGRLTALIFHRERYRSRHVNRKSREIVSFSEQQNEIASEQQIESASEQISREAKPKEAKPEEAKREKEARRFKIGLPKIGRRKKEKLLARTANLPTTKQLEEELKRERTKKEGNRLVRNIIFALVTVSAAAVLVATLFLPILQIYGTSMTPTLTEGDIVLSVKGSQFERGDVISFYYNNKILVKRVIAFEGEYVNIGEDGTVYINNKTIEEPYLTEKAFGECDLKLPYQVPAGKIFVLGDHRDTSVDSRSSVMGCISEEQIVGKIIFRVWPFDQMGGI